MSVRAIVRDIDEEKVKALKEVPLSEQLAALWYIMAKLKDDGNDIGTEGDAMLANIKARIDAIHV